MAMETTHKATPHSVIRSIEEMASKQKKDNDALLYSDKDVWEKQARDLDHSIEQLVDALNRCYALLGISRRVRQRNYNEEINQDY